MGTKHALGEKKTLWGTKKQRPQFSRPRHLHAAEFKIKTNFSRPPHYTRITRTLHAKYTSNWRDKTLQNLYKSMVCPPQLHAARASGKFTLHAHYTQAFFRFWLNFHWMSLIQAMSQQFLQFCLPPPLYSGQPGSNEGNACDRRNTYKRL